MNALRNWLFVWRPRPIRAMRTARIIYRGSRSAGGSRLTIVLALLITFATGGRVVRETRRGLLPPERPDA